MYDLYENKLNKWHYDVMIIMYLSIQSRFKRNRMYNYYNWNMYSLWLLSTVTKSFNFVIVFFDYDNCVHKNE